MPDTISASDRALQVLTAVAEATHLSADARDIANGVADAVITHREVLAAIVYQLEDGALRMLDEEGLTDEARTLADRLPLEGTLAGLAVARRQVVSSTDPALDDRVYEPARRLLAAGGARAVVAAPLLFRDVVVGALVVMRREAADVTAPERALWMAVGRIVGLALAHAEDATARRALERTHADTLATLRLVVDALPLRVFWKDREHRYLGCNERFAGDAGLSSPHAVVGLTDRDLPWRAIAGAIQETDRAVLVTGQPLLRYHFRLTRADGREHAEVASKMPLRDAEGEIIGTLGVYHDEEGLA